MVPLEINDDSMRSFFSFSTSVKRRVRFAETALVHPIANYHDMSQEELRNSWYRKCEFDDIKRAMVPLIKAMMRGEPTEETDEVTFRGLEYRTRQGALKRQHNKVMSITSVLDEQDRQRSVGNMDIDCIKNIYINNSAHCLVSARQLGIEDEEAVRCEAMDFEPFEFPSDDFSLSDSEDSVSMPSISQQKFKGITKLVKKLRRKQQSLYNDIADLDLPSHVQGIPQAA